MLSSEKARWPASSVAVPHRSAQRCSHSSHGATGTSPSGWARVAAATVVKRSSQNSLCFSSGAVVLLAPPLKAAHYGLATFHLPAIISERFEADPSEGFHFRMPVRAFHIPMRPTPPPPKKIASAAGLSLNLLGDLPRSPMVLLPSCVGLFECGDIEPTSASFCAWATMLPQSLMSLRRKRACAPVAFALVSSLAERLAA